MKPIPVTTSTAWALLTAADVATVQFQNTGLRTIELTRGTTDAPLVTDRGFMLAPNQGTPPAMLDTVLIGEGLRIWGRSQGPGELVIGWT